MKSIIFKSRNTLFAPKRSLKKVLIFGMILVGVLLRSDFAVAAHVTSRPTGTVSAGSWTAFGASTLHEATDETSANDDTDYAEATVNTTAEVSLNSVPDPGVNTDHVIRWRYKPAGTGAAERIVVDLYQGSTLIRSSGDMTGTRGSYNNASFALTGTEADSITDYADLRLRMTTNNLGDSESMRVTWLEFEVIDNTPPSLSISEPNGVGDVVTAGNAYNITYSLSDIQETVTAAFYYDTDNTGLDGVAILGACAAAAEGTNATCAWDTTGVAAGDYFIYGITSDGVNPQVSAYSSGTSTVQLEAHQEIINKLTALETQISTLQTQVSSTPQNVWEYTSRSLTDYAAASIASSTWAYSGRSLDNISNISQGVWGYSDRALTSFGTLVADVWSYSNRSLTTIGSLASDIWNDTFAPTRRLTDTTLAGGGELATSTQLTLAKNEIIAGLDANEALINALNDITAADVWSYGTRGLTENVALTSTSTQAIWDISTTQLTASSSIGKLIVDNLDATISSRSTSTLTAADIWSASARTLTDYATSSVSLAVWSEANRELTDYATSTITSAVWSNGTRTLTSFGTLVADVWSYSNRSLTTIGSLASDIWNDTFAPTRRLTDATLAGGGELATSTQLTLVKDEIISRINASTTEEIVDAVWNEVLADHLTAGSAGNTLNTASSSGGTGGGAAGLTIETHTVSEFEQGDPIAAATIQVKSNGTPVSGVAPVGVYYDPNNNALVWPGEATSSVSFAEIGNTGMYVHNFDTAGAALGVYKLVVTAAQSQGGTNYTENFTGGTIGQDMTGWGNTGLTYTVENDPLSIQGKTYHKSDYGGFAYAFSNAAGDQDDFTYEAKVMMPSLTLGGLNAASDFVGITFRYANSGSNYELYFRRLDGNMRLRRSGATLQTTAAGTAFLQDHWYRLKVVVTGGEIKAYACEATGSCDEGTNLQSITYTDSSPLPAGKIGVMTFNSIGFWDDFIVTTTGTSQYAYIAKDFAVVTPVANKVWNAATSSLVTTGSIGKAFADNRTISFKANGEIVAGSGTNNYKAKLHLYDLASQAVNASANPSITLYQPDGTVGAGPTTMTFDTTGVYSYQATLGSGAAKGRWEAVVTVDTGGTNPITASGYFEVESSPAQVIIHSITDTTVPSIVASATITNEGSVGNEYQYEYCIVDSLENTCGGGDDVAYALAAKFINPGEDFNTNLTLTANTPGTYYFKLVAYWSTEKSVAVLQFNAVSESDPGPTPTPTPTPGDGGGAGGAGGAIPSPTAPTEPATPTCQGADFNLDRIVDSIDFSILLFFWKTEPPFRNSCVDINKDAQVNSVDFSILLFRWGGPGINKE